MRGNTIKKVKISRINLLNYNTIKKILLNDISKYIEIDFIYDVPEETDFDNIDVLYISDDNINIKDLLIKLYNPEEIVVNDNVISFSYYYKYTMNLSDSLSIDKELFNIMHVKENTDFIVEDNNLSETEPIEDYYQIDLIKCTNFKNMIMAKFYFSYGDLGRILETMLKYYEITLGSVGLWCNIKKETIKKYCNVDCKLFDFDKIILTEDPREICKYLNLDYEKWCNGFYSKESIFNWIINCIFFDKDIYLSIKLNSIDNCIYEKLFYNEFLNYIKYKMVNLSNSNLKLQINRNQQLKALKYFNKIDKLKLLIKKKINKK